MANISPPTSRGASKRTLAAASAPRAGAAQNNHHAHLLFDKVVVTRELAGLGAAGTIDPDSRITVVCEATPNRAYLNRHDRTVYHIAISRATVKPDDPVELSALTLGLQDTRHTICIRSVRSDKGDAVFLDANDQEQPVNLGKTLDVPPTALVDAAPGKPDKNPAGDSIWFLRFSGANCYVEAFALDRVEDGRILWTSGPAPYGVGHDNTPPPSEPS